MVSCKGDGKPKEILSMPPKKDTKQLNIPFQFQGFSMPHYTQVPDQLFDELLPVLNGSELKVLLYICRRTFGFKKDSDNISINQMLNGIMRKNGTRLDHGAGLRKTALLDALRSLVEKNIILAKRRRSSEKGNEATNYRLHTQDPLGRKSDQGEVGKRTKPLGQKPDQEQETVEQHTDAALVAALLRFGIDKPTVDRLVKKHDSKLIWQKIDFIVFLQEEQSDRVKNPKGWLLKAIEDDYDPPAGYRSKEERKLEALEKEKHAAAAVQNQNQIEKMLQEASVMSKDREAKALKALQAQCGTTEEDIELWQGILNELRDSVGGLTHARSKSVNLLKIEDDIAFFAAKNMYSFSKINDNGIGKILYEMFKTRGYYLKDMKPIIMDESVL